MRKKISKVKKTVHRSLTTLTMLALFVGSFGFSLGQATPTALADETVKVAVIKYIDGAGATATSADNLSFTVNSSSGDITLGPTNSSPYEFVVNDLAIGSNFNASESMDASVGLTCADGKPFSLVGYTTGDSFAEAAAGTPSAVPPSFTNMQNTKFIIVWNHDCGTPPPPPSGSVNVTIHKYIDGEMATGLSASNHDFGMNATWNAANLGGPGSGTYVLGPNNPTAYQALTADMNTGSDYSTSEDLSGALVGASCSEGKPFALVGYTSGETAAEAAAATPSAAAPAFTAMTTNKHVIVWNDDCATPPPTPPATVKVTINKFIDGVQATAGTANNVDFPMSSSWTAANIGSGSGQYALSASGYNGDPTPYQAKTVDMTTGADYSTSEDLTGLVVGASCSEGKPFALVGYTSGDTMAAAQAATPAASVNLTGMTSDKFIIVWNDDCSDTEGTIGGDVTGGSSPNGTLAVTSVEALDTTATADGTFENGWKYVFNITVPDDETNLAMKFSDWSSAPAGNSIAAANNIRISSPQANNGGATVLITAANTYSTPELTMTGDLNAGMAGKQVKVTVEVKVPSTTVNGSYTTTYGVRTQ